MKKKPFLWGLLGCVFLASVYFGIMTLASSAKIAYQQFLQWWPWMTFLVLGFGVQVGLFSYMQSFTRVGRASVALSGSVSGASMIACCTHHLTDVLPLVGLSFLAALATTYQGLFFSIGIASNAVGIAIILHMMQKHQLCAEDTKPAALVKYFTRTMIMCIAVVAVFFVILVGLAEGGIL